MTTPESLAAWAREAKPGESHVYFTGHLARSKEAELAAAAYALQEAGVVHLLQKRLGPEVYAYIAQRRACAYEIAQGSGSTGARERRRETRAGLKILKAMEVQLKQDLAEAQETLTKTAPGTPSHAKIMQFAEQCERVLQFIGAEGA